VIINALCDHYDILAADDQVIISRPGFQKTDYVYTAILTEEGDLFELINNIAGKKNSKPQSAIMPLTMKSSAVGSSPVCDNMSYIFGVDDSKGKGIVKFNAAKALHMKLFENTTSREGIAVRRFFEKWNPADTPNREEITRFLVKGFSPPGNVVFRLVNETTYFHDIEEICEIWRTENARKSNTDSEYVSQCTITGATATIAKLHTQLSGVKGAQATGASLVCFNKPADESYNLPQSHNARVSELAMFKYTTTLQYLLDSGKNKLYIGDDTCVFWASSPDKSHEEIGSAMLFGFDEEKKNSDEYVLDRSVENDVKAVLSQGSKGLYANPKLDPDVRFYVLGLAPNAGRVSVRYFYQSSLAEFCDRIKRYYNETQIAGNKPHIKISSLIYATVSTKSSDKKVNLLLGGAVMRAVLSGSDYPVILFNQIISRVKAEADSPISQTRAAAIKAYLTRNKKEEILPMLNKANTNSAYVLGRTFAILEMIQKNSVEGKLNATIKDKYFASACSNPALVFPTLLKLSQHHLAKIGKEMEGLKVIREKQLSECLGAIEGESFPKAQNMENQGRFILGYYQQNQELYKKKEDNDNGSNKE